MESNTTTEYLVADAQQLPIRDEVVNGVATFSLMEHLPRQEVFMKEVERVLKQKDIFIMQFPNRRFPVELHTGVFFLNSFPKNFKNGVQELCTAGTALIYKISLSRGQ